MALLKKTDHTRVDKDVERALSSTAGGMHNGNHLGKESGRFLKS